MLDYTNLELDMIIHRFEMRTPVISDNGRNSFNLRSGSSVWLWGLMGLDLLE